MNKQDKKIDENTDELLQMRTFVTYSSPSLVPDMSMNDDLTLNDPQTFSFIQQLRVYCRLVAPPAGHSPLDSV